MYVRTVSLATRDYVNSTLLKMKTRQHCLLTLPPPMAQRHSPPYSSPSPMWLLLCLPLLSQVIVANNNHHRCHQHPQSPCLLLCPAIVMHSSSSFPHFPLQMRPFRCRHHHHIRLHLPPTSTVFCLIGVCC